MPRKASICSAVTARVATLKASIDRLDREEQQHLYQWLGKQLKVHKESELLEGVTRNYEGKTYVAQKRRCGKLDCDCMEGKISEVGHGPYWYVYWHQDGKTHSKYVGKRPPWQKDQLDKNK